MRVKRNKVKIVTLGCSKNLVDSERIMAQLANNNIEITDDENKCDTVLINTCGFIESAKQESIDTILKVVKNKEKGRVKNIFVAGCLSDRYLSALEKEIPEVNKYFGATDKISTVSGILKEFGIDYKRELTGERVITTPGHFAYIKISEGCDNPCSFCAIPIMRGGHKSVPIEDIINEAENLAVKGVRELIVIGQDTTYYGKDLYGKQRLSDVLNRLSEIKGIEWIRLMYAYPSGFPEDVLDTINANDKICKYIDIPMQHISDNMLKAMRRGITKRKLIELLEKIRNRISNVAVRTALITGYPGETKEDFNEMLKFIGEYRFDRLGVFTYSHEEGTYAAGFKDNVTKKEKFERQKMLLEAQRKISLSMNEEMLGKKIKVLVDRRDNGSYTARTYRDAPEIDQEVIINTGTNLNPGEFYDVNIIDCEEYDLFAELDNTIN